MNEKRGKGKENQKVCPFNSDLECEDCRFYRGWDAQGPRCLFESLLWSIQGIDLFGKKR